MRYLNKEIFSRFDELISDGEVLWEEFKKNDDVIIMDIVSFTKWATSCLNLLDKLSVSTNRFVKQFEIWVIGGPGKKMNIGAALGVLKSAKHEYSLGLAVEYHLSVSSVVFSGLLDEASYLLKKGYNRAATVIFGAALEEGLKTLARSMSLEIGARETLNPVIIKLKAPEVGAITEFDAKQLEAIARMRNDAAHGGEFNYSNAEIQGAYHKVENMLGKLLSNA